MEKQKINSDLMKLKNETLFWKHMFLWINKTNEIQIKYSNQFYYMHFQFNIEQF